MSSKKIAVVVRLAVLAAVLLAVGIFLYLQPSQINVFQFSKLGTTVTDTYFVSKTTDIQITAPKGTSVYYTTDGSTPDENSTLYTQPLVLDPASGDFPNCLLLKAIAFYADGSKSEVVTHTLWAHKEIADQFQVLLFSVSGNPAELTEGPEGILFGENVWLRGEESERQVYVEAVSAGGHKIFAQSAGARVYGMLSRNGQIQSLKLYARKQYDPSNGKFNIDVFGTVGHDSQIIDRYDRLVVRNSSNSEYDFNCGFIRDELNQKLIAQAGHTDYQETVPAVMYLNGAYYGYFWLHENYCDDFLKDKYGDANGHYEIIEGQEQYKTVDESDPENAAAAKEFNALYSKYAGSDLTNNATYAELASFIDVNSYLENIAYNTYVCNVDWPHNNYKCYRYYAADNEPYGTGTTDGKWRFLYHDLDFTMGNYGNSVASAQYNTLADLLNPNNRRYCPLFAKLMERTDCKDYFISEIIRLRDGALSPQNVISLKNELVAQRQEDMDRFFIHMQTLPGITGTIEASYATYEKSLSRIDEFITNRANHLQAHLISIFNLPEDHFG